MRTPWTPCRAAWIALVVLLVAAGSSAGELAPDFQLKALRFYDFGLVEREITKSNAGELYQPVKLSDFREKRRVALILAAPDWKPLLEGKAALERLADSHERPVQFLLVVVRAASGSERTTRPELARLRDANILVTKLGTEIPCLIDGPDDPVRRSYAVEGGRVVLVDRSGRIGFRGASGELDLEGLASALGVTE